MKLTLFVALVTTDGVSDVDGYVEERPPATGAWFTAAAVIALLETPLKPLASVTVRVAVPDPLEKMLEMVMPVPADGLALVNVQE
jgi:hypothetical protein